MTPVIYANSSSFDVATNLWKRKFIKTLLMRSNSISLYCTLEIWNQTFIFKCLFKEIKCQPRHGIYLGSGTSGSSGSAGTAIRLNSQDSTASIDDSANSWMASRQTSISMREWDIPYEELKIMDKIGSGRFSTGKTFDFVLGSKLTSLRSLRSERLTMKQGFLNA